MDVGNIKYCDFTHGKHGAIPAGTKVVLLSVDVGRANGWVEALRQARSQGMPIMRIVIDEAQMILTSQEYRKRLRDIYEIRSVEAPLVLLTANATPDTIPYFIEEFGLSDPLIIRTLADRPEIKYTIETPLDNVDDGARRIKHVVADNKLRKRERWIVFVTEIAVGYALATALGVECYHAVRNDEGHNVSEQELQRRLSDWMAGKVTGIVATSALACGNDFPHIRIVFHWGVPRTLIDFLQESGRAARDGKPGLSVVF
ncbi:P-loop containing nucleoside triphosphate hydrolase protein, partial [Schizophyllum commune]